MAVPSIELNGRFGHVICKGMRPVHDVAGSCLKTHSGHREGIQAMSISPDGQYALTGSDDCSAKIFEFDFSAGMH